MPPVLKDISVQLPSLGLTALRGSNGSGKSTFIEAASGYLGVASGQIRICGMSADAPSARAHRRVVRNRAATFPAMTVGDHLALSALVTGGNRDDLMARAEKYALTSWLDADASTLSTGNLKKLWVLMCTAGSFDLVLLDEPFSGLDDDASALLWDEILRWSNSAHVVLATHQARGDIDVDHVLTIADGQAHFE